MKHIYELQRIDIRGRRYPQRRTNLASMGFFSTQENAVEAMHCFLADFTNFDYDCRYPTWLGFVVTKYGVDSGKCEPLYQCTYSHEGKFNDENLADENGVFRGRPAELLRFGKGDIVEVYDGEACLGIVYGTPLSPARCSQISTPDERGRYTRLDRTDDQYTILFIANNPDSYYHDHIESQFVFPPTKPISPTMATRLKALAECDN